MIIALDFDNTIIENAPYPSLKYKLKPDIEETIRHFTKDNIFVLNSARYDWYRIPAIFFIKKHKLPIKTPIFNRKIQADIYIDDKNIFCKEVNWKEIAKELERLLR